MLMRIVTLLGLKNSPTLLKIYRLYILIRYKNQFNQYIQFGDFEIKVGMDLSLFPALIRGDFECKELEVIGSLDLGREQVIWDIGANVGVYSIFFARTFPQAKIVSFEPARSTWSLLTENLRHNKCDQVLALNFGVGKSLDMQYLRKSKLGAGSNSIVLSEESSKFESESIQMTTIDSFVASNPFLAPKLIKIDVEGYEPQVIFGGKRFIALNRPIIIMEVFPLLWAKESHSDWKACLGFLFNTYGQALEIHRQKSKVITNASVEKSLDQKTLLFGLSEH